jgi:hypothetical protein
MIQTSSVRSHYSITVDTAPKNETEEEVGVPTSKSIELSLLSLIP